MKKSECIPYLIPETLDEIFKLNRPILVCTEYKGYYYIQVSDFEYGENEDGSKIEYNNSIYQVNEKTLKIDRNDLDFIGYKIDIEPKATPVDPETLRKRVS